MNRLVFSLAPFAGMAAALPALAQVEERSGWRPTPLVEADGLVAASRRAGGRPAACRPFRPR